MSRLCRIAYRRLRGKWSARPMVRPPPPCSARLLRPQQLQHDRQGHCLASCHRARLRSHYSQIAKFRRYCAWDRSISNTGSIFLSSLIVECGSACTERHAIRVSQIQCHLCCFKPAPVFRRLLFTNEKLRTGCFTLFTCINSWSLSATHTLVSKPSGSGGRRVPACPGELKHST